MRRVITSVTLDLKFNVDLTPPTWVVAFTDIDDDKVETRGTITIDDGDAAALFKQHSGILKELNAAIDAKAETVKEPGSVAERLAEADQAERRRRAACAAVDAAEKVKAALEAEIAAKRAELARILTS